MHWARAVAAGKSGRCSFCAQRWPQALLPRATSSLILIRSHKRADALEQEVLWVSTSGAGFDVGGPASAVQVRDGVLSPRDEVVITTRGNGILSVRAVRASRFSRAPLECSRHRSPVAAGWLHAEITPGPKRDFSYQRIRLRALWLRSQLAERIPKMSSASMKCTVKVTWHTLPHRSAPLTADSACGVVLFLCVRVWYL